jgi:hypothetical protein
MASLSERGRNFRKKGKVEGKIFPDPPSNKAKAECEWRRVLFHS